MIRKLLQCMIVAGLLISAVQPAHAWRNYYRGRAGFGIAAGLGVGLGIAALASGPRYVYPAYGYPTYAYPAYAYPAPVAYPAYPAGYVAPGPYAYPPCQSPTKTTSPPRPPSPPDGPPKGMNFSRRNAMEPLPPAPAMTLTRH